MSEFWDFKAPGEFTFKGEEIFRETVRQMMAIEDTAREAAVIEFLRDKGYTVTPPVQ